MHTALDLELDKTSALDLPVFLDDEKDFWLNAAIKKFVKTRYSGLNIKKQSFEETQKRIDDLRTLVTTADVSLSNVTATYPNGYVGTLPTGNDLYWLMVGEEAEITVDSSTKRVGVTQCSQNEYRQKIDDPYSEHILHYTSAKPIRLFYSNSVELISDGNYTVDTYYLTYIKEPAEVDLSGAVDCDLPEHTHDEIVKITCNMMLENIESPRYASHANEIATME